MEAAVFDMDGVLVDSRLRHSLCLSRSRTRETLWECLSDPAYVSLDVLREDVAAIARDRAERGYVIIVLTARHRSAEGITRAQLERLGLLGVVRQIIHRNDSRDEVSFKVEELKRLSKLYRIAELYEDSEQVIRAVRRELPWIRVFSP